MDEPRPAGPCAFVIFGASGDLTKRLLIPALYHLKRTGLLPEDFALIGISRAEMSDEDFRASLAASLRELSGEPIDSADWSWLASRMHYMSGDLGDPTTYERLQALLRRASSPPNGWAASKTFSFSVRTASASKQVGGSIAVSARS